MLLGQTNLYSSSDFSIRLISLVFLCLNTRSRWDGGGGGGGGDEASSHDLVVAIALIDIKVGIVFGCLGGQ